jgi:enoyl-CoA hydratase/carnithine racemase
MVDWNDTSLAGMARRDLMVAGFGAAALAVGLGRGGTALAQTGPNPAAPAPSAPPGRVVVEQRGAVLMMGIEWPQGRNRLDAPVIIGLGKAYYQFEHDDGLRVGVLYADGPDFCAGLDVPGFVAAQAAGILPPREPIINPLDLRPPFRTKPIVVAVQGRTQSVGHELFLSSDIRVAAINSIFGQLEVTRGVFPAGGATVRFPREAGWGNAMRYMLTGDEWGTDEARRMGLVQEVTPLGKQLDRAVELANKIAAAAPLGVRATLASSHQALAAEEATALAALQQEFGRILQSEDAKESQRAQREGRPPVFHGQ